MRQRRLEIDSIPLQRRLSQLGEGRFPFRRQHTLHLTGLIKDSQTELVPVGVQVSERLDSKQSNNFVNFPPLDGSSPIIDLFSLLEFK